MQIKCEDCGKVFKGVSPEKVKLGGYEFETIVTRKDVVQGGHKNGKLVFTCPKCNNTIKI